VGSPKSTNRKPRFCQIIIKKPQTKPEKESCPQGKVNVGRGRRERKSLRQPQAS